MNEKRLIDASAVRYEAEKALRWYSGYPDCGEYDYAYECAMRDATKKICDLVDNARTIDAAIVVHASKIDIPEDETFSVVMSKRCSDCRGYLAHDDIFCARCGSKMDKGEAE